MIKAIHICEFTIKDFPGDPYIGLKERNHNFESWLNSDLQELQGKGYKIEDIKYQEDKNSISALIIYEDNK